MIKKKISLSLILLAVLTSTLFNAALAVTPNIAAGSWHSLALKSDGTLWATGYNRDGQLGNGSITNLNIFIQILSGGVSQVACGYRHSLALKSDGTLWATGLNDYGQLGDGTNYSTNNFMQVLTSVNQIAGGDSHSLALKSDGTLWATGWNGDGQLGDGTNYSTNNFIQVLTSVNQIAGGANHSLALKSDGTLWATGWNGDGQLGDGTNYSTNNFIQVLTCVNQIAAGDSHSLALKSDGTLWVTGLNDYGQLGDGTNYSTNNFIQGLVGVNQIAGGSAHSLALKSDGTLWVSGWNGFGQLGNGANANRYTWTQVSLSSQIQTLTVNNATNATLNIRFVDINGAPAVSFNIAITWESDINAGSPIRYFYIANSNGYITATRNLGELLSDICMVNLYGVGKLVSLEKFKVDRNTISTVSMVIEEAPYIYTGHFPVANWSVFGIRESDLMPNANFPLGPNGPSTINVELTFAENQTDAYGNLSLPLGVGSWAVLVPDYPSVGQTYYLTRNYVVPSANQSPTPYPITITLSVTAQATGLPLNGALVGYNFYNLSGNFISYGSNNFTNSQGQCIITLNYVSGSAYVLQLFSNIDNYIQKMSMLIITKSQTISEAFSLLPASCTISGRILTGIGQPFYHGGLYQLRTSDSAGVMSMYSNPHDIHGIDMPATAIDSSGNFFASTATGNWELYAMSFNDIGVLIPLTSNICVPPSRANLNFILVPNSPPSLSIIGLLSISENDTLTLTINVSDPDGDSVRVTINSPLDTATYQVSGSGTIVYTYQSTYLDAGSYTITISASDSRSNGNVATAGALSIAPVNSYTITANPNLQIIGVPVGTPLSALTTMYWDNDAFGYLTVTSNFQAGQGYWVRATNDVVVDLTSINYLVANKKQSLKRGWNMISNPQSFPVAWNNVVISYNNQTYNGPAAVTQSLLYNGIFEYNNGYSLASMNLSAKPWRGYWVAAIRPVDVIFPSKNVSMNVTYYTQEEQEGNQLELQLKLLGTLGSSLRLVGSDGNEKFTNLMAPPAMGNSNLRAYARKDGINYITVQQEYNANKMEWSVQITSEQAGNVNVSLSEESNKTGQAYNYYLVDEAGKQQKVNNGQVTLYASAGVNNVKVEAVNVLMSSTSGSLKNYPNPFNPDKGEVCRIAYDMGAGNYKVQIYTLHGRKIRTLEADLGAGEEVVWDGKDDNGVRMPTDAYVYLIKHKNSAGTETKAKGKIILWK